MKRILLLVNLPLAAFLALTPRVYAQEGAAGDRLIVPGQRIGNVHVGMTVADLYKTAGDTKRIGGDVNGETAMYFFGGIEVYVKGDTVFQVQANSAELKLENGLAKGASDMAVRAMQGSPSCTKSVRDGELVRLSYPGVSFWTQRGAVLSIDVISGTDC